MPFRIIRNDITKVHADAVVNTANPEPTFASGTDSAIYEAAGAELLLKERRRIGPLHTGEAVATAAFHLPAKYIIHTVGPAWWDGTHGEFDDLAACYRKSLLLAEQLGCRSIAFPLISTGVYGFPKDRALTVALEEIADFLTESDSDMDVILVVFDKRAYDLSASLVADVGEFIDENYVEEKERQEYGPAYGSYESAHLYDLRRAEREAIREAESKARRESDSKDESKAERKSARKARPERPAPKTGSFLGHLKNEWFRKDIDALTNREEEQPLTDMADSDMAESALKPFHVTGSLEEVMLHVGETFQEQLFRLIDERHLTDAEVYKKANLDRKLFSKIRCNAKYQPQKRTALALAIALRLSVDETTDLLRSAGLAFSPCSKADLIVVYCMEHDIYDLYEVNALLFEYEQVQLGG